MNTLSVERKHLGVIGHPLGHTMSPLMHTTAITMAGIPYDYGVFDVVEEMVEPLLVSLRKRNFRGANVTVPYKKTVMPYLDTISDEAVAIGAVNTIVNDDGILTGYNTDILGVQYSLREYEDAIRGNDVAVFGAGGAARSVLFALSTFFAPRSITIINRTPSTGSALSKEFREKFPSVKFEWSGTVQNSIKSLDSAKLIINTTSVGMLPDGGSHPLPHGFVMKNTHIIFDIVYNPLKTALLQMAETIGARTISGLEMLVGQGDAAFKLFTGTSFPIDQIRTTVWSALDRNTHI